MTSNRSARARSLAVAAVVAACVAGLPFRASHAAPAGPPPVKTETAAFAGGCFWCMESVFDHLPGVLSVTSGYTGGRTPNPTYEQVSDGGTGHAEAVQVVFDPARVSYARLLDAFWHNVDPVTPNAQFCDHGSQYRSAIFANGPEQMRQALASRAALEASHRFKQPIVTQVVAAGPFYAAEEYHQHYYKKNPARYTYYRWSCGRDRRLHELWGDSAGGAH
ncbi:MAG TPA: peptide-methionine (S)-S-oxide reductase MsrA [Longimicrobiaceae bacterium]|nr:peptide-methionine (S)-S-oxide reductase MsrA [Longimicrobiaceae bacterium]